jgi:hypothetical protein
VGKKEIKAHLSSKMGYGKVVDGGGFVSAYYWKLWYSVFAVVELWVGQYAMTQDSGQ